MSEYNEFELPDYDFEDEEDEKVQVTRRRRTKKEEPGFIIPKDLHEIPEEFLKDNSDVKKIVFHNEVKKIGKNAFSGCEKLKEIEFSDSIIEIEEEAFSGCIKLETVTLPESLAKIGKEAFSGCKALKTIIIRSQIEQLPEAVFKDCINLKEVILPEKLIKIGKEAFRNCCKLSEIILPEHLVEIDEKAFYGCKGLKSISIPAGVTEIKDKVFFDCENLENVKLPDTLESIGVSAFEGCSLGLKTITIPENTQLLKDRAFARCGLLKTITLNKTCFTNTDTDSDTFDKCYNLKMYSSNQSDSFTINTNEIEKTVNTHRRNNMDYCIIKFGTGVINYFKERSNDDDHLLLTMDNDIYEKILNENNIDKAKFEKEIKKHVRTYSLSRQLFFDGDIKKISRDGKTFVLSQATDDIKSYYDQALAVAIIAHQMKLAYDSLYQDSSITKKLSNFYYNTDDVQINLYCNYFYKREANPNPPTSQDAIWSKAAEGFKRVNRSIYDYSSLKESQDKYVKYIEANLINLHSFEFDFLRLLFTNEINRKTFATKEDFEKYFVEHKKDVLRRLVDKIYDKINNKLDKYIVDYQKNAIIDESILMNQFWRMYENWDGDEPEYRSYNADNSSNNNDFYVELYETYENEPAHFECSSEQAVTLKSDFASADDYYKKFSVYGEEDSYWYVEDSSLEPAACPTSFAILIKKDSLDKFSELNRTEYLGKNEFSDYIVLKYSKYPENFYEKLPESYKSADFDKPKLLGGIKVGRNEFLNIQGLEPKLDSQKYKNESVENPLTGTETITILANGEETDSYRLIAPQKKELPATIKTVWEKINAQKSDRQAASEISEKKAYETLNAGKNTTVNPKDYIAIRKKDGSVKYVSIVSKEYKMVDIISTVPSLEQECPYKEELIKFQEGIRIWLEHVGVAKWSEIRKQCLRLRLIASDELLKELGDYPEYKIFIPLVKLGIAELYYDDSTNGYVYGIAKSSAETKSPLEYLKALPSLKDYITNSTSIFEKIDDMPTKGYVRSYQSRNLELITLSEPCIFKHGKESYRPDYFYMNSKEAFRLEKFIPDSKDICNSYIRAYKIIKEKCKWEKPFEYIPQKKMLICNYLKGMPSVYVRALIMQDKEALTRSGGEIRLFACNNHNKQVFYNIDEAFVSELEKKFSDI